MRTLAFLALVLAGCASTPEEPEPIVVERLGPAAAANAIRPLADGDLNAVRETTPPGLFERLAVQTFQVSDGPGEFETYALAPPPGGVGEAQAVRLGTAFGGPGVTGYFPADVDRNGEPDLAFAYGSGQYASAKRYNVGLLDRPGYRPPNPAALDPTTLPAPAQVRSRDVDFAYRDPIALRGDRGGRVEVWDEARGVRLGTLRAAPGGRPAFDLAPDLPPHVRKRLLSPRP